MQLKQQPLTPEQQREKLANRIFSHFTVLSDGLELRPDEVNRYRFAVTSNSDGSADLIVSTCNFDRRVETEGIPVFKKHFIANSSDLNEVHKVREFINDFNINKNHPWAFETEKIPFSTFKDTRVTSSRTLYNLEHFRETADILEDVFAKEVEERGISLERFKGVHLKFQTGNDLFDYQTVKLVKDGKILAQEYFTDFKKEDLPDINNALSVSIRRVISAFEHNLESEPGSMGFKVRTEPKEDNDMKHVISNHEVLSLLWSRKEDVEKFIEEKTPKAILEYIKSTGIDSRIFKSLNIEIVKSKDNKHAYAKLSTDDLENTSSVSPSSTLVELESSRDTIRQNVELSESYVKGATNKMLETCLTAHWKIAPQKEINLKDEYVFFLRGNDIIDFLEDRIDIFDTLDRGWHEAGVQNEIIEKQVNEKGEILKKVISENFADDFKGKIGVAACKAEYAKFPFSFVVYDKKTENNKKQTIYLENIVCSKLNSSNEEFEEEAYKTLVVELKSISHYGLDSYAYSKKVKDLKEVALNPEIFEKPEKQENDFDSADVSE